MTSALWQRPIERIYGNDDRITFIPLAEGQTLPPSGLPTAIRVTTAASAGATSLAVTLVGGTTLPKANCLFLAFEHPVTGEEFLAEVDGNFSSGTLPVKPLDEPIPENAVAKFPHRLLGLVSYSGGNRGVDFAVSAPITRKGWENVQPTTRSNELTAEAEFYALGADYLTLNYCLNNALEVWIRETSNTPKAGFVGEIREARYFVAGMERGANNDVPICTWRFRRNGEEYFTRAKKA